MSGSLIVLAVPLVALVVLVVVAAVLVVGLARRPAPAPSQAAEVARRHGRNVHVAAWIAAVVVPPVVSSAAPVALQTGSRPLLGGVLVGLAPAVAGSAFLAAHLVGERTWPRPTGTVRRAALEHRRVVDVVPRPLLRVTAAWTVGLALVLVAAGLTAADDGRSVVRTVGSSTSGASPYPGWFYGVPLLVATAVVVVLTAITLRVVTQRPAVVDADPTYDAASRRLSGHRVLRGTQLVLALTLAGVLFFAGNALRGVELVGFGAGTTIAGVLVALTGAALALVPAAPPVTSSPPWQAAPGPARVGP
ncbi:hypothetical protein [Cellulomonas carbonis]|uniref:Uncharacterized protein n=1 Tax=Cellulomonas carbonis T26 TaxID=947969 RepID=A0A0A0BN36_9CELL|nr:hypothetical protein [Cellulomonas carbonis]KGM09918.1 hypothetical protein N868_17805 [Cellulomonas carbonis T26]GGC09698.1 hypothetical protein GCM10010972_23690 [Cellulomonas carbonis]